MISELEFSSSWAESAELSKKRAYAGCSFSQEHGLIISGGKDKVPWKGLASVENTFDGETVEESVAQMPEGIYSHCLVDLEGGDLFKEGGLYRPPGSFIVRPSDKTHVYRVV